MVSWWMPNTYRKAGVRRGTATSSSTRPGTTSEIFRLLPDGDPDNLNIRGIRSDAESSHSQFKRTLITERAMSVGWRRGLIDYYAFAWYSNALTEWHAAAKKEGANAQGRQDTIGA